MMGAYAKTATPVAVMQRHLGRDVFKPTDINAFSLYLSVPSQHRIDRFC